MLALIGKKIGMTQVFDDIGRLTPVTVIKIDKNVVIGQRTQEKNGYEACILGAFETKESKLSKPVVGQFSEGVAPQKELFEVRDFEKEYKVGDAFGVELFENLPFVDVEGTSKGKGYQGVMKRHGFGGGRKTHGSKFHRAPGSTGNSADPSKTVKGRKMPGRMGADSVTVQNLQVVKIDVDKQVLLVKGAVPGRRNSTVMVKSANKK